MRPFKLINETNPSMNTQNEPIFIEMKTKARTHTQIKTQDEIYQMLKLYPHTQTQTHTHLTQSHTGMHQHILTQ